MKGLFCRKVGCCGIICIGWCEGWIVGCIVGCWGWCVIGLVIGGFMFDCWGWDGVFIIGCGDFWVKKILIKFYLYLCLNFIFYFMIRFFLCIIYYFYY